jgi:hypothetical protein
MLIKNEQFCFLYLPYTNCIIQNLYNQQNVIYFFVNLKITSSYNHYCFYESNFYFMKI